MISVEGLEFEGILRSAGCIDEDEAFNDNVPEELDLGDCVDDFTDDWTDYYSEIFQVTLTVTTRS